MKRKTIGERKMIDFVKHGGKIRYERKETGEWCDFCDTHTVNCFGFWTLGDEKYIQICLDCMKKLGTLEKTLERLPEEDG